MRGIELHSTPTSSDSTKATEIAQKEYNKHVMPKPMQFVKFYNSEKSYQSCLKGLSQVSHEQSQQLLAKEEFGKVSCEKDA